MQPNPDFQKFADNYSSEDFDKITFDWNGQPGDKLQDKNYDFRVQLSEFLVPQLEKVKLELIRDLYHAHSLYARESWSVYSKYHLFAQQLLGRGGRAFLMDYLRSSMQSYDTLISSGQIVLTKEQAEEMLDFIAPKMEEETDPKTLLLLQFGKWRLERIRHAS